MKINEILTEAPMGMLARMGHGIMSKLGSATSAGKLQTGQAANNLAKMLNTHAGRAGGMTVAALRGFPQTKNDPAFQKLVDELEATYADQPIPKKEIDKLALGYIQASAKAGGKPAAAPQGGAPAAGGAAPQGRAPAAGGTAAAAAPQGGVPAAGGEAPAAQATAAGGEAPAATAAGSAAPQGGAPAAPKPAANPAKDKSFLSSVVKLPANELAAIKKMLQAKIKGGKSAGGAAPAMAEGVADTLAGVARGVGRAVGGAVGGVTGMAGAAKKGFQTGKDAVAGGELSFADLQQQIASFTADQAQEVLSYIQSIEVGNKAMAPKKKPAAKKPAQGTVEPTTPQGGAPAAVAAEPATNVPASNTPAAPRLNAPAAAPRLPAPAAPAAPTAAATPALPGPKPAPGNVTRLSAPPPDDGKTIDMEERRLKEMFKNMQ